MAAHFFMIYIERKSDVTYDGVKKKMDHALDWYRIKEDIWIVYSTSDPEKWYERLGPLVKESGNLFVCQLDVSNRQGWMPKEFWKWLKKSRQT